MPVSDTSAETETLWVVMQALMDAREEHEARQGGSSA
jgi:hypothetical protein